MESTLLVCLVPERDGLRPDALPRYSSLPLVVWFVQVLAFLVLGMFPELGCPSRLVQFVNLAALSAGLFCLLWTWRRVRSRDALVSSPALTIARLAAIGIVITAALGSVLVQANEVRRGCEQRGMVSSAALSPADKGYLMIRSGLVPRGMAILGLIGGALVMASGSPSFRRDQAWIGLQGIAVIPSSSGSCRSASITSSRASDPHPSLRRIRRVRVPESPTAQREEI
jgi:hypothetical protein